MDKLTLLKKYISLKEIVQQKSGIYDSKKQKARFSGSKGEKV